MNNPDSQQIVCRFFWVLDELKSHRVIRGRQTFTDRHDINRWNMNTCEKTPASNIFQLAWLCYLVSDFPFVNAKWLLTGLGKPFLKPLPEPPARRAPVPGRKRGRPRKQQTEGGEG